MGKILFEFIIPALLLTSFAVWGVKVWYLKRFGRHVDAANKVNKASARYERQLKPMPQPHRPVIIKPEPVTKTKPPTPSTKAKRGKTNGKSKD